MKIKYFSLYILITLFLITNTSIISSQITSPEPLQRRMSALMQSAFNASHAAVQKSPMRSLFIALGASYVVAETISYKCLKKTFLVCRLKKYAHDIAYWAFKKVVCIPGSPKPKVLCPDTLK